MTHDQDREMAAHNRYLCNHRGVYFADPARPPAARHQRIHQRPQTSDLSGFTQKALEILTCKLNTLPRKSPGLRCPAELLTPDAFDFRQHHAALFALGHSNRQV